MKACTSHHPAMELSKTIHFSTLINIYKSYVPLDFLFSGNQNESLYKSSSCYGVEQNNIFVCIHQGLQKLCGLSLRNYLYIDV